MLLPYYGRVYMKQISLFHVTTYKFFDDSWRSNYYTKSNDLRGFIYHLQARVTNPIDGYT